VGFITFPAVPATYIAGNLVGGLVFGVGMALSGY
jgi:glutaredoxin-related protein